MQNTFKRATAPPQTGLTTIYKHIPSPGYLLAELDRLADTRNFLAYLQAGGELKNPNDYRHARALAVQLQPKI